VPRYLILSDIHGNWDALDAVLRAAGGRYDAAACLGDLVGYGAEPNRVIDWAREQSLVTIRGNHDRACSGLDNLEDFNPAAKQAAEWTQTQLTPANLAWLRELPRGPAYLDSFCLVHGAPLDEDHYLLYPDDVLLEADSLDRRVTFFGHTHVQGGFEIGRRITRLARPHPLDSEVTLEFRPDCVYLLNPGSVGQPRDRDPRAAFALYDPAENHVTFRRASYAVGSAQFKIRHAGLPDLLASRLEKGA
jgi:predicted phosphodiesterase